MDRQSIPTCPECTGNKVYSVTDESDGKRTWHCETCKHNWPVSEADQEKDPFIWHSPPGSN
jgi:formate dehydrogenase maturation protein FdhE